MALKGILSHCRYWTVDRLSENSLAGARGGAIADTPNLHEKSATVAFYQYSTFLPKGRRVTSSSNCGHAQG
jgi:hypothetical protein